MKIKELFTSKDMTIGKPYKRLAEFAVPMIIGNMAQQLYNTVDSVVVGHYIGDNALAAVGSATPILNLLLALFVGVSTGAGIIVSQYFGAKDREKLSLSIGNCILLTIAVSLLIMIIGPLLSYPLLKLLSTPDSIIIWCADYLNIFFYGMAGFAFYNMLSGILRGMGDSFSALVFLIVAAILNIFMDILFVARYDMGVAGVALATVLAQAISAILCLIKLLNMRDIFDLNFSTIKFKKEYSLRIIKIGIPSGITQAVFSVALLAVQSLTNSLGELVIASNVIIMRVDGFAMLPNMSFGQAQSVFTGQNVGAKRLDRVESGCKQGTIMALCVSTALTLIILIFGKYLMAIFTDTTELIDLSSRMMRILAFGYICISGTQVLGGVMRGAGDTVTPMWISIISSVLLRVPLAYLFVSLSKTAQYPNGQPQAIYLSMLCSWIAGLIMSIIAFKRGAWKKKIDEVYATK